MPEAGVSRAFRSPLQAPEAWASGAPDDASAARQKTLQILAVFAFPDRLDQQGEAGIVDIALAPGDLLGAADLQALAILDGLDELGGAQQARRRAGVEPGIAAAQFLDGEASVLQVMRIDVGDLEFTARRARYLGGDVANIRIVEIEAGHRPVRLGLLRLLEDADRLAVRIEFDHAVGSGIGHPIGVDHRAASRRTALGHRRQRIAVEKIVAQDQADPVRAHEAAPDQEHFGDAAGLGLHRITDLEAPLPAIAEQAAIGLLVVWIDYQQDLATARQHQRAERVVDHRLVVDRQELLVGRPRHRVKPRTAAAG